MGDFRRLEVWQEGRKLVKHVYSETAVIPKAELFGLTSQMRRAAISVAANIAEGRGKNNDRELNRYLGIALGSATELECLAVLGEDLGFLPEARAKLLVQHCQQVQAMIAGLQKHLLRKPPTTDHRPPTSP